MKRRRSPVPKSGEEWFSFLGIRFNVSYALEIIGDRETNNHVLTRQVGHGMCRIDTEYAMSDKIDITKPIIVATLPGMGSTLVIDGHHRGYRAEKDGVQFLPAHILTEAETREVCVDRDLWRTLKKNEKNESKLARKVRAEAAS